MDGRSFVRLDHHSAVGDMPVWIQRSPHVSRRRVACNTSPEALVVLPTTAASRGTVGRPIIVVLIIRREFHSVVHVVTKISIAVQFALILERVSDEYRTIILLTSSTSQSLSPSSSSLNY